MIPLPCTHLGTERINKSDGRDWRHCNHPTKPHGAEVCTCKANTCGPTCSGYPKSNTLAGVVIGCYSEPVHDMRGVIELQIRVIRANCGPVPILLTVDQCEHLGSIECLGDKYDDVTVTPVAPERIGHAGGDLGAFYHGLRWANNRGLRYLAKLSQRFIIDRPKWLQESAATAAKHNEHTLCDHCIEGRFHHPIRSESVFMEVARWQAAVPHLVPRRVYPAAGEAAVWAAMRVVGLTNIRAWNVIGGPDRCRNVKGIVWKCSNPLSDYQSLADKYGVHLGDSWAFHGWPKEQLSDWG